MLTVTFRIPKVALDHVSSLVKRVWQEEKARQQPAIWDKLDEPDRHESNRRMHECQELARHFDINLER